MNLLQKAHKINIFIELHVINSTLTDQSSINWLTIQLNLLSILLCSSFPLKEITADNLQLSFHLLIVCLNSFCTKWLNKL